MTAFNPITLQWDGTKHEIAPFRVMGAIACIEETITLVELYDAMAKKRPPLSRIARAYSDVLNYAGAKVSPEEVYASMFGGAVINQETVVTAIATLLAMMQPPASAMKGVSGGNGSRGGANSSKKRTKQRSATTSG